MDMRCNRSPSGYHLLHCRRRLGMPLLAQHRAGVRRLLGHQRLVLDVGLMEQVVARHACLELDAGQEGP